MTAHLPPANAENPGVPAHEDRSVRVPTVVTPHTEYSAPRASDQSDFTSGQAPRSVAVKQLTSVVPSVPSFVSTTTRRGSQSSSFSGISSATSESNLDPINAPEVAASASTWTKTVLLSSDGINVSVKPAVREVPPSTSPLETEYCELHAVVSGLQKEMSTNKQPLSSAPAAAHTHTQCLVKAVQIYPSLEQK